jgi:hypothetical protein
MSYITDTTLDLLSSKVEKGMSYYVETGQILYSYSGDSLRKNIRGGSKGLIGTTS